mmetsp:Transcript_136982/g.381890  ORF Transcript_136982/g.381890 Transcript_136982/m.381890 type:complete len:146 (-) Transcript_136982:247-684(-)
MPMCGKVRRAFLAPDGNVVPNSGYVGPGRSWAPSYSHIGNTARSHDQDRITHEIAGMRQDCMCLLGLSLLGAMATLLVWVCKSTLAPPPSSLVVYSSTLPPNLVSPSIHTSATVFDCEETFFTWRLLWSTAKRRYCCAKYSRGCL